MTRQLPPLRIRIEGLQPGQVPTIALVYELNPPADSVQSIALQQLLAELFEAEEKRQGLLK